ncbi:hypothetical protein [Streptomyces sp. NPDC051992]|jgi:hypothetical protein|uniref:hypothetical protein n=1 Tax=unclassified Streptomyces TaxID=2593676 RepID=UPI003448529C
MNTGNQTTPQPARLLLVLVVVLFSTCVGQTTGILMHTIGIGIAGSLAASGTACATVMGLGLTVLQYLRR